MLLKDKVALVTGGAKGIGRAISLTFAEEGGDIAVVDIDAHAGKETAELVKEKRREALFLECDVTRRTQVEKVVGTVIEKFGKIDILVNNAGGITTPVTIEDMPEEVWDEIVDLNLKSHFLFCKFVVPHMKKVHYGKIIGLSSIGATLPPAHSIHYNAAKGGVISFTYDLAATLAPYGINVNCIAPGPIRTHFFDEVAGRRLPEEEKDALCADLAKVVPLGRVGTPPDIAGAALFLASELASFVTGHCLYVSGGLPLRPLPDVLA